MHQWQIMDCKFLVENINRPSIVIGTQSGNLQHFED
jgi:hypothetical protein